MNHQNDTLKCVNVKCSKYNETDGVLIITSYQEKTLYGFDLYVSVYINFRYKNNMFFHWISTISTIFWNYLLLLYCQH